MLTPSTPLAYQNFVSRTFAPFRVDKFDVRTGQRDFCSGNDSRQLTKKKQVRAASSGLPHIWSTLAA